MTPILRSTLIHLSHRFSAGMSVTPFIYPYPCRTFFILGNFFYINGFDISMPLWSAYRLFNGTPFSF